MSIIDRNLYKRTSPLDNQYRDLTRHRISLGWFRGKGHFFYKETSKLISIFNVDQYASRTILEARIKENFAIVVPTKEEQRKQIEIWDIRTGNLVQLLGS